MAATTSYSRVKAAAGAGNADAKAALDALDAAAENVKDSDLPGAERGRLEAARRFRPRDAA
jgi:hypothetical protein